MACKTAYQSHSTMAEYRALRDEENKEDTDGAWDRVELKRDSNNHREDEEEEEEEDPLLCDPEEMDLLREIFDTLSSRSCHDRGVLYGTRSLDLFGPDSHAFITEEDPKDGPPAKIRALPTTEAASDPAVPESL